jgi:nucleoid DNA-binding protein
MGTFAKKDLVKEVSARTGLEIQTVKENVDCFLDVLCEGLGRDGVIEMRGFGIFRVKDVPDHAARNPRTGEKIRVPAKRMIHFKASLLMKERLKQGYSQGPVLPLPEEVFEKESIRTKPVKKESSKPSPPSPHTKATPSIILPARK